MKRVVVLGGSGFLGSRVVTALKTVAGLDVKVASRHAELVVDVTDPSTYPALEGAELVIDLTDATSHEPDRVLAWCLDRGMTVIEATSDAPCVERLFRANQHRTTGALILGGGIFTGVSNLLARSVASRVTGARSVTFGVATSPLSGAGVGTVALMVHSLGVAAVRFVDGVRSDLQGLEAGPRLAFGSTHRATVRASLAEPFMIQQSLGVPSVDAYLAPKPGVLAALFLMTPAFAFTSRVGQWLMRAYFTVLRRVLLRSVPTAVELVATASGASGKATSWVSTGDGMMAGAWALAAMAEVVQSTAQRPGVSFIDQVTSLEPIMARTNALAGQVVLELHVDDAL